ncbi:MAG TPA: lamin tail domain-containing protein, partial [Planctomycetes bacterium]|nr:lamin tail domain-containing protein [Planctomycetota bacterium]
MVPWIAARTNYLTGHSYLSAARASLSNLSHTPTQPTSTDTTYITVDSDSLATSINFWSRPLGKFQSQPMFDDGLHGDGAANDDTWGVALPPQAPGTLIDYYVEALTSTGAARFEPYTAELERECHHIQVNWPIVPSDISINEFVAQNQTGPVDENGQHEDWLELYNSGTQTIDVGGMWLSDTLTELKWQIPVNNLIAPNGVLRVWCDEDGTQGPLHANFKLASGGETVVLYAASGA